MPRDPNPLFLTWLKEWEVEAKNKGKLPLAKIYSHCQQNLAKYPLPLENGLQCKIIVGFGKTICTQLEEKLQRHLQAETDAGQPSSLPLKEKSRDSENLVQLHPSTCSAEERVEALKTHLPSFPLSPVAAMSPPKLQDAPKSPPFRRIENLRLSPARHSLLSEPLPDANSSRSKLSLETQSKSINGKSINAKMESRQAAFSSMASVFDSPPPIGERFGEKRGIAEVMTESLEAREARELETALALSQAEAPDHVFDSDLEYAKRLQKEEEERHRKNMEVYNTDELPDIEENEKDQGKTEEEREAEDLELAMNLSQQDQAAARSVNRFEEDEELPDVEMTDARDLEMTSSLRRSQMIGGEGTSSSGSQIRISKTEDRIVGKLGGLREHRPLVRSPDRGEEEWASEALQEFFNKDKVFGGGRGGGRLIGGKTQVDKGSDIGNSSRGKGRKTVASVEPEEGISTPARIKRKREDGGTPASSSRKRGGSGRKEYVPRTRTGAYAVLLTLAKEEADDSWRGHLLKAELQTKAQPLCNESLTHTSVHREHYSAWSSVKTLLKHELVAVWSNPAKYKITDKGRELAIRILELEKGGLQEELNPTDNHPVLEEVVSRQQNSSDEDEDEDLRRAKEESMRSFQADFSLGSSFASDFSPEHAVKTTSSKESAKISRKPEPAALSTAKSTLGTRTSASVKTTSAPSKSTSAPAKSASAPGSCRTAAGSSTSTGADSLPLTMRLHQMARQASQTSRPARDTFTPQFRLSRGRFEILLCVDNTETSGGGAGGRKNLKTETIRHLKNTGVQYDTRGLNIGDFLWVAREKVGEVGGQFTQPKPRELVLPFLVERKRQDDFWASVKDGRYEEQKYRMKNSGLEHLFYLVEEYQKQKQHWGRAGGDSFVGEALEQAVANTAVQEGFSVKRTSDQRSTIEYLTLMTRLLREKYKDEELVCITQSDLEEGKVRSRDTALLEFQAFNDASKKSKKLTVKEVFAKTLLRMKGLSPEMAQAIVETYPCPALLRDALLAVPEPSRLPLLTNIRIGIEEKRKLPKAIAEAVIKFWTSDCIL